MAPLALLDMLTANSQLLAPFVNQFVKGALRPLTTVLIAEEPEQEEQQDDGNAHSHENPVQLGDSTVELSCTGFQLTILTRLFLKVEIEIAVIVAGSLVINGSVGYAKLFADTGHEVGCLVDERVRQCQLQMLEGSFVIALGTVAGGERTIGSRYLIHVAIILKQHQRFLCHPYCQLVTILQPFRIHHCQATIREFLVGLCRCQVFGNSFQGVGLEIGIVTALGYLEATQQAVHLLLIDVCCRAVGQDSTCPYVVEIVQELCRVLFHVVSVDSHQGIYRLLLESYIIEIGGGDDGQFRLGIEQASLLMLAQQVAFLIDTLLTGNGPLTVIIEVLVT